MYYLYILTCADGTLYTGITVDLQRRIAEHNSSTFGAKYTRGRRPVRLVFAQSFRNRSLASREESRIKKLSRSQKLDLISFAQKTSKEQTKNKIIS
ncbi:MAG: GIY-YIG nuclease family protein [Candidatus Moraniibacteriota bacterium]